MSPWQRRVLIKALSRGENVSTGLNVLVTGGAGYIGSATAALLLQQGHRVTIVDNLSRGHRQAVSERAR
jgi:nucleoside-diphosphate-sugar epimerase